MNFYVHYSDSEGGTPTPLPPPSETTEGLLVVLVSKVRDTSFT